MSGTEHRYVCKQDENASVLVKKYIHICLYTYNWYYMITNFLSSPIFNGYNIWLQNISLYRLHP